MYTLYDIIGYARKITSTFIKTIWTILINPMYMSYDRITIIFRSVYTSSSIHSEKMKK